MNDYSPPKFSYAPKLFLDQIIIDPENERQTTNEISFYGLVASVRRKGVITPVGVEIIPDGTYKAIYGNRRILAAKEAGLRMIKAKIYSDLTPELRLEMQIAENATKERIPLEETAENLWDYYKFRIELESGGEYTVENLDQYGHYDDLPQESREIYPAAKLAGRIGFSERILFRAFNYVHLHPEIKRKVVEGEVSYNFAQELGRIPEQKEQLSFLERVLAGQKDPANPDRITNRDQLSVAVSIYLRQKTQTDQFALQVSSVTREEDFSFRKEINLAARTLGNFGVLAEIDPEFRRTPLLVQGRVYQLKDLLERNKPELDLITRLLTEQPQYAAVIESLDHTRRSIFSQLFERRAKGSNGAGIGSEITEDYIRVPINLVHPDLTQPRKTFDPKKLEELAKTIRRVGLLQPPLVKLLPDGTYQLIVGHRRTAAARLAGLTEIEVLVAEMEPKTCREIQYEEDIYEKVILSERAESLYRLFCLKRHSRQDYTLKDFAEENSSLGTTTILKAITFAGLDKKVKLMHSRGLLGYSTAVAIAKEWESYQKEGKAGNGEETGNEDKESWIMDWAIEASLTGYNAETLRRKVFDSLHQLTFEDYVPDLFGGETGKRKGRRHLAFRKVFDSLQILPAIAKTLEKRVERETLTAIEEWRRKRVYLGELGS